MNILPNKYKVKDAVRNELLYQFENLYDEDFYHASKKKQMHYIAIILEILSWETDDWQEDEDE